MSRTQTGFCLSRVKALPCTSCMPADWTRELFYVDGSSSAENPMLNGEMVDARFVFDRQAGPHIILTCKDLTKEKLGLGRRPSYWDLPIELQANLVGKMVRCGTAFASKLGLPDDTVSWHMEIHLGTWVVGTARLKPALRSDSMRVHRVLLAERMVHPQSRRGPTRSIPRGA